MKSKILKYMKTFEEELAHMSSSSKLCITILAIWLTVILAFSFIGIFINDVLWFDYEEVFDALGIPTDEEE